MRQRAIRRLNPSDRNIEKTKSTKETWLENLNVDVIELHDAAKSQFLREALNLILSSSHDVDGEPEKVLAVRFAANGSISFGITIPAGEAKGLILRAQELQPRNEPAVDV